jgi:short subunit dehydrogenase-like uncharacterized protein
VRLEKTEKYPCSTNGKEGKVVDFGEKQLFCMTIPWGDVSTAFFTTGIPNIKVFTGVPKSSYNIMKFQFLFNPIVKTKFVKGKIQEYVDQKITGPSKEKRKKEHRIFMGRQPMQKVKWRKRVW